VFAERNDEAYRLDFGFGAGVLEDSPKCRVVDSPKCRREPSDLLPDSASVATEAPPSGCHLPIAAAAAVAADKVAAGGGGAGGDDGEWTQEAGDDEERRDAHEEALRLLGQLRPIEAASLLERQVGPASSEMSDRTSALEDVLQLQLAALEKALLTLGAHPGLQDQANVDGSPLSARTGGSTSSRNSGASGVGGASTTVPSPSLFGARIPMSPAEAVEQAEGAARKSADAAAVAARKASGNAAAAPPPPLTPRDLVDISFQLDDAGHSAEGVLEFFPDGKTVSVQWVAKDLPVTLQHAIAFIHEIDLLVDMVPFLVCAEVLHQFPWNSADRLVRVASRPPIPFVAGLEAVAQRFGFDLLDTPWAGLCLVESGPRWLDSEPNAQCRPLHRGVPKPPPYASGFRSVEVKNMCALARPTGRRGELTTIICSASGDLKVPRSLLPNWLISYLVKTIGRMVFARAMDRVAKFDSSEHGARIQGNPFYKDLSERINQHLASQFQVV